MRNTHDVSSYYIIMTSINRGAYKTYNIDTSAPLYGPHNTMWCYYNIYIYMGSVHCTRYKLNT